MIKAARYYKMYNMNKQAIQYCLHAQTKLEHIDHSPQKTDLVVSLKKILGGFTSEQVESCSSPTGTFEAFEKRQKRNILSINTRLSTDINVTLIY